MSTPVFLAVLVAALLHASWNAVLKVRIEPLLAMTLVNGGAGLFGAGLMLWTGFPAAPSWPWLAASTVLHLGYALALTQAYRRADMGLVYPIARGSAPLMTMLGSLVLVRDPLAPLSVAGILVLATGIGLLALRGRSGLDRSAVRWALLTAVTISLYTLADGMGARAAGDPHAYIAAVFLFDGLTCLAFVAGLRGLRGMAPMLTVLGPGLAGGAAAFGAYWIAVWAMTQAPIALVAAVRETSVLFATAIAVIVLREPLMPHRIVSAVLIVAGLALIRMG
ncbi:EamA family transporter [Alsobacter sp. R-9]